MNNWTPVRIALLFVFLLVTILLVWDSRRYFVPEQIYSENFDNEDPDLILGGQLTVPPRRSPWKIRFEDGKLIFKNRTKGHNTHLVDINWVRFDGSEKLSPVQNADIAVTVTADSNGLGGAGVIVGSVEHRRYWFFGIDDHGRYHVFRKRGSKLTPVTNGYNVAILQGEVNRVFVDRQQDKNVFFVNDQMIIEVPTNGPKGRPDGVGLSAFGKGTYYFDDLVITQ